MLPDRVSNPGPLTYESGALPTALRDPATSVVKRLLCMLIFVIQTMPASHFLLECVYK